MNTIKKSLQDILELEIMKNAIARSIHSFSELERLLADKTSLIEREIERIQSAANKPSANSAYSDSQHISLKKVNTYAHELKYNVGVLKNLQAKVEEKLDSKYEAANISTYFRTITPISYFIQLFELGVVDDLHGINGAYNIYQSKISSGEVTEYTLEGAMEKMDAIKPKQFILYDAIQRAIPLQRALMIDTLKIMDADMPAGTQYTYPQFTQTVDQINLTLEEVVI